MNTKKKLLGYYNYTVILTYVGMLTGCFGITKAFEGRFLCSAICLMIAGFCDMFDGAIAATRERTPEEKCFGIQIDSLSDLICFGILPAAIVYSVGGRSVLYTLICGLYILCALIRLAYFNVDEQERQKSNPGPREIYYGMPVTLSAIFIPLTYGIICCFTMGTNVAMAIVLFAMAILFVLPVEFKKPQLIGKLCFLAFGLFEIILVVYACMR